MTETGLESKTTYFENEHSTIYSKLPVWINGWVSAYDCELESSCNHWQYSMFNFTICGNKLTQQSIVLQQITPSKLYSTISFFRTFYLALINETLSLFDINMLPGQCSSISQFLILKKSYCGYMSLAIWEIND